MVHFLILANNFSIMKSPKPYSVGRVVVYVPFATDYNEANGNIGSSGLPAIIVNSWNDLTFYHDNSQVNLKVFTDGPVDLWRCSVPYDENKTPGSWHWPAVK
jgi:hypothetical protein